MDAPGTSGWLRFPRRHPVITTVFGLFMLIGLALAFFNWNWARGPIQRMVSSTLHREFRIDGDLDVDYFPLEVHVGKLFLANASWSEEPTMASVGQLDMRLRFWPLFIGRMTIPHMTAERPFLRLERNDKAQANWAFGMQSSSCTPESCKRALRIQQLLVNGGRMEFREPAFQTSLNLGVQSVELADKHALAPLMIAGAGRYRNAPFRLEGQVDSPLALQGKAAPFRADISASAGDTRARAYGALEEPLQTEDIAINFELSGPDLALLYDYVGIVLPKTPPYALHGRLSRHGDRFSYDDFTGTVGDSDLGGDATLDIGGTRPKLTAMLESQVIDFDDLAGFIGGNPGTDEGETSSAGQKKDAAAQRASGKLLPQTPIDLAKLRAMDADVQLKAARVESRRLPLENMAAHLKLTDGQLVLDPLDFGAAGGTLANAVHIDARGTPAAFALDMKLRQLQLPKLMPRAKVMQDSIGSISGNVTLKGHGDSAASVLASSNGDVSAIMGSGRISNLVLEIAGLDIAEALAFLIGKDRQVTLRCAYVDIGVADGVATARSIALDSTDTALLVRGGFSFRDESLDMTLLPRPKDASPVSVRVPINIGGTFADPAIAPQGGPLLLRGAAVAALAAIAPPLALLGLVETGPGKEKYCASDLPDRKEPEPQAPIPGPRPPQLQPVPHPDS